MEIVRGPRPDGTRYHTKFIQIEGIIYVASNSSDSHRQLTREAGLSIEEIEHASQYEGKPYDAGELWESYGRNSIEAIGCSVGLNLPFIDEARVLTGEVLNELFPGYKVEADLDKIRDMNL